MGRRSTFFRGDRHGFKADTSGLIEDKDGALESHFSVGLKQEDLVAFSLALEFAWKFLGSDVFVLQEEFAFFSDRHDKGFLIRGLGIGGGREFDL